MYKITEDKMSRTVDIFYRIHISKTEDIDKRG